MGQSRKRDVGLIERVFYDTWAWKETALDSSSLGRDLRRRFGPAGPAEIHTSILALAEYGSKLARDPTVGPSLAAGEVRRIESTAHRVHNIEMDDVYAAVKLHPLLRAASDDASLADALMLAQARRLHLRFISGDPAFRGQDGVPQDWIKSR